MTKQEVEELIFDQDATQKRRIYRSGDAYEIFGETVGGRLLKLAGEFRENGQFRVFAARDMTTNEKRTFRKKKS